MSIRFLLPSNEELHLKAGIPPWHKGRILKGAYTCHASEHFGNIFLQQLNTEFVIIRKIEIHWDKPDRLICHYNNPNGLFSRLMVRNNLHEYLKGAGDIYVRPEEFSVISGSSWYGLISATKPGDHIFYDISCSDRFLKSVLNVEHPVKQLLSESLPGLPHKLVGPVNFMNAYMRQILDHMYHIDVAERSGKASFHQQMKNYYRHLIEQTTYFDSRKRQIKPRDWTTVHFARQIVDSNLQKAITTTELSRLCGMNEFKLKQLFPKIAGRSIDEHRKYMLCVKASGRIVRMLDFPIKHFSEEAGYKFHASFSRGFQKLMSCYPNELRQDTWDLKNLPHMKPDDHEEAK